jgi:hypothetical protein
MPTLARLQQSKIAMYAGDHNPPHFHVLANDGSEALLEIASLTVWSGRLRAAALREALAWARLNKAMLAEKWKALNP